MFEKGTREKIRFDTLAGDLTIEDMWDLPLRHRTRANLDDVWKTLNRAKKDAGEESLLDTKTPENTLLDLKLDIVTHIIKVKIAEREAAKQSVERKAKRDRIDQIIAKKQNEELENMSEEDLWKMRQEL